MIKPNVKQYLKLLIRILALYRFQGLKLPSILLVTHETLKNLVTMASHEYFSLKLKQDEIISEMLDIIINSYYDEHLLKLSQK